MTLIDRAMLAEVAAEAGVAPRRRKNRNFHPRDDYPGHRLLIGIEPDSYVTPHRHLDPNKDETLICLRGRLGVILFDAQGEVERTVVLAAGGAVLGVDIPHGVFHTVVALESGTVIFEAKAGPYVPLSDAERPAWAPAEGCALVGDYLGRLRRCFAD